MLIRSLFMLCITLFTFGCEDVHPIDGPNVDRLIPRPSPIEYPKY